MLFPHLGAALAQRELGLVLRQYGGPWPPYERVAIGNRDPWGERWADELMVHDLKPFSMGDLSDVTDTGFGSGAEFAAGDQQEEEEEEDEMEKRR